MRAAAIVLSIWLAAAGASANDAGPADAGVPDAGPQVAQDAGAANAAAVDAAADAAAAVAAPAADLLPEELRPRMTTSVTPESGTMTGDLVTLTIEVDAAEGDEVNVPDQSFAPFEVFDDEATEHEPEDGRQRYTLTLQLLALGEPGEHEVGPVRLRVVTADGTLGVVETEPVTVRVGSVLGNEPDAQPRPPTEPVQVLEEDYTLAWVGGSLLALLVLALAMFLLARWWMRREKPAPPPPPPRAPWAVALEELGELRRTLSARLEAGEIIEWADALSDTMRVYLGRRYDFDGLESTTDEVLESLRKKKPQHLDVPEVAAMLGDLDLVKFAKASPGEEECGELLATAFKMVRATQPSFGDRRRQASGGAGAGAPEYRGKATGPEERPDRPGDAS